MLDDDGSAGGIICANTDCAIVDVGLPDRKGDALVSELRALFPGLSIVIASGYEEAPLRARFRSDRRTAFLNKPYTQEQLLEKLNSLRS